MSENIIRTKRGISRLTDNESNAVKELKEKMLQKYPASQLILYGSKARGDYNRNSDLDILIVIKDNYDIDADISFDKLKNLYFLAPDRKIRDEILEIIIDIETKYDIFIDFQIRNRSYLETNVAGVVPLYQNIKKDGILL
ncbi:MAG: nucleotidyltransferase family protein [bacterium]